MLSSRTITRVLSVIALAGTLSLLDKAAPAQEFGAAAKAADTAIAGADIMTRGPIHEAFAEPASSGGVKPLTVTKKPPSPIDEVPADARPADESAVWIGGYWAWDDDRTDFIWVSGVWRVPPPGQRWVAGYWSETPTGYSWVPGFWTSADQEEMAYFPEPPASLEQGPTTSQPAPNDVWIPGNWRWMGSRFAWQPGYWAAMQPGWVWITSSYCWSPQGWIFCNGYWDYPLDRRGLLFAPVRFASRIYDRPGFVYTPSVVIDAGLLTFSLFTRPSYGHYYFGDYYAASYDSLGIFPWFAIRGHRGYTHDPLFAYYRWQHRNRDVDWISNLEKWHGYYRAHPEQRPPHDWASMRRLVATGTNRPDRSFLKIADSLSDLRNNPTSSIRITSVPPEQMTRLRDRSRLMREFGTQRAQMEARHVPGTPRGGVTTLRTPQTLRLPDVARRLTESAPGGSGVRQTLKPVIPFETPNRLQNKAGESGNPAARQPVPTPGGIRQTTPTPPLQPPTFERGTRRDGPSVEQRRETIGPSQPPARRGEGNTPSTKERETRRDGPSVEQRREAIAPSQPPARRGEGNAPSAKERGGERRGEREKR